MVLRTKIIAAAVRAVGQFCVFFWKNGPGLGCFLVKNGTVGQFCDFFIFQTTKTIK